MVLQLPMELYHSIKQSVQMLEVMVVRHASPHVLPDIFLGIEFRCIGWQPFELDLMSVRFQQPLHNLRAMGFVIVDEQNHPALRMGWQLICPGDGGQQSPKTYIVATMMNHVDRPASDDINSAPVPALGRSHPGRQNDTLLSNRHPTPRDSRKQTHFSRVSEKKDEFWSGLSFQFTDSFFSLQRVQDPAYA